MDQHIEFMLKFLDSNPVQLSEKHQKQYDLPKLCTVGDVRNAVEADKALKSKIESDVKMVEELKDITEL